MSQALAVLLRFYSMFVLQSSRIKFLPFLLLRTFQQIIIEAIYLINCGAIIKKRQETYQENGCEATCKFNSSDQINFSRTICNLAISLSESSHYPYAIYASIP
ncbi:Serine hydroxymethyltransferase [Dirofilaria immitis]